MNPRKHDRAELRRMKETMTYIEIAAMLGISRQRVGQLMWDEPSGWKFSVTGECPTCHKIKKLTRHHESYDPPVVILECRSCHQKRHPRPFAEWRSDIRVCRQCGEGFHPHFLYQVRCGIACLQKLGIKRCVLCQVVKPLDEFHNCRSAGDGKTQRCKPCNTAYSYAHSKRNPKNRVTP